MALVTNLSKLSCPDCHAAHLVLQCLQGQACLDTRYSSRGHKYSAANILLYRLYQVMRPLLHMPEPYCIPTPVHHPSVQVLHTELTHISGQRVVQGDLTDISNLVEILAALTLVATPLDAAGECGVVRHSSQKLLALKGPPPCTTALSTRQLAALAF